VDKFFCRFADTGSVGQPQLDQAVRLNEPANHSLWPLTLDSCLGLLFDLYKASSCGQTTIESGLSRSVNLETEGLLDIFCPISDKVAVRESP